MRIRFLIWKKLDPIQNRDGYGDGSWVVQVREKEMIEFKGRHR